MLRRAMLAAAIALVSAGAPPALAGRVTGNLDVTASVFLNCSISTNAITFGIYDPTGANSGSGSDRTATGAVVVTCTKNAGTVAIGLGLGSNPTGTTRRMFGGASANYLAYELYQPASATPDSPCSTGTPWGPTGATQLTANGVGWGAGAPKTFNVCGVIRRGQEVSGSDAGEPFTDTIVATVTF